MSENREEDTILAAMSQLDEAQVPTDHRSYFDPRDGLIHYCQCEACVEKRKLTRLEDLP